MSESTCIQIQLAGLVHIVLKSKVQAGNPPTVKDAAQHRRNNSGNVFLTPCTLTSSKV